MVLKHELLKTARQTRKLQPEGGCGSITNWEIMSRLIGYKFGSL